MVLCKPSVCNNSIFILPVPVVDDVVIGVWKPEPHLPQAVALIGRRQIVLAERPADAVAVVGAERLVAQLQLRLQDLGTGVAVIVYFRLVCVGQVIVQTVIGCSCLLVVITRFEPSHHVASFWHLSVHAKQKFAEKDPAGR